MVTQPPTDEPADFAGFRARRAALKEERRRQKARDNFTAEAPDYGREIPPRLNPDVPDMVDRVKACYVGLTQWMTGFQQEIAESADAGKLDRAAEVGLLEHYRDLQEAVDAATPDALSWHPVAGVRRRSQGGPGRAACSGRRGRSRPAGGTGSGPCPGRAAAPTASRLPRTLTQPEVGAQPIRSKRQARVGEALRMPGTGPPRRRLAGPAPVHSRLRSHHRSRRRRAP